MAHKTKSQRLRDRQRVTVWFPKVNDLILPDVPPGDRAEARKILGWLDGKFPVQAGTCWKTAQALALVAKDRRVQYVEGVSWNVKRTEAGQYVPTFPHDGECVSSICVCKPLPHAWNVVNGHVVDLQGEFYNWRFPGSEYLHEPLKVYSLEDIPVGGVSGSILQKVWMEEHPGLANPNRAAICQHVFKDASDRLIQRVDSLPEGRREMTAELFYSRVPCRYPLPCISPEPSAQDYVMSLPEMQRRTALSFGRL